VEEIKGKVAIITGASGNLGRAVAENLYRKGAILVLVDLHNTEIPGDFKGNDNVLSLSVDLSRPEPTVEMAQSVLDRFGRIDIVANIAGGFTMGTPVHETSVETWDFMIALNAVTVLNTCRAVIPVMRRQRFGKVINIGARAALAGKALMAAYVVSKSAVIRLTESLSEENKKYGINVNCVLPGIIDTPQNRCDMPDTDFSLWVRPEALADVIAFLASDASRAVHGAAIPVSGLS